MTSADLALDEIHIGDTASFSRTWEESDVETFARLSGDTNPLHMDDAYAETTSFKQKLVHGMLLGSLCSALVGMYLPGKRCLYLNQTLAFKKPVFIGDTVKVTGTVTTKSESTRILEIKIVMTKEEIIVLEGKAVVQVLP